MTVIGREWFCEDAFPVVELAAAINSWLCRGDDFEFETVEAEESPFLWVRRAALGCVVGAAWQAFAVDKPLQFDLVREALANFTREISISVREQLHVEVDDLLGRQAG
jgi:hypothetical protein